MANGIDPRRLVSREGDVEEAAREYEASKSAQTSRKTDAKAVSHPGDVDEAAKAYADDKSKTASGVSYAEYAKNAQSAPACTSDHPENCPVEGSGSMTVLHDKGARGVEITFKNPNGDKDVKVGTVRVEVGTQNEIGVTAASKEKTIGKVGDTTFKVNGYVGHAHAGAGLHNPDGSTGVNATASAAAGGIGISAQRSDGTSFGATVEAGESVGGSFGFKDDGHGKAIACVQANVGPVQVNFCTPTALPGIRN